MDHNTQPEPDEQASRNPAFSRFSIARTIWKRKICAASIFIVSALAAFFVVRGLPAVYSASATILVDSQKIPEKFVSATVATGLEDRIAAIRQQLLSSGELKKIIDDFGLYQKQRKTHFEEEILELMRKDVAIELVPVGADKRPGAFRIGYQGPDPTLVTRVANRLTDLYVEQNLKTREGQAEGTSEFLGTQLTEAKKRLDALEAAVSAYKLTHNGELPEQETSLATALAGLHSRLEANRDAMNRAQQTRDIQQGLVNAMEANEAAQTRALEAARSSGDVGLVVGPQGKIVPARKPSEVLQERLELLLTQYTESYPEVRAVRDAIQGAKRLEDQQETRRKADEAKRAEPAEAATGAPAAGAADPPELVRTREQIAGLKGQIKAAETELANRSAEQRRILREIDQYQGRIERLPIREQEVAQLTRDYEMAKENYKSLLAKQTAAEMALDMERRQQSERFTVLDRARVPPKPVKPNRPLLYALGLGASLALGLVAAFTLELRTNVFLGEWELPDDTPILARLPFIEVPMRGPGGVPQASGRRKQAAAALTVLFCLAALLAGGALLVF